MRTIWKYTVPVDDEAHTFEIPSLNHDVVHVGSTQGIEKVDFWVEVETDVRTISRSFTVVGTGHKVPKAGTVRGSVVVADGRLVWHLVEL